MMKNVQVYLMDIAIFKNMSDLWFLQSIITMNLFGVLLHSFLYKS